MNIFQIICGHPLKMIHTEKEQTVEPIDNDFEKVTYHLYCTVCNKPFKVEHARTRHGVDAFLNSKKSGA